MEIGSHNSWTYLTPRRWWQRLLSFTARCQRVDIATQYEQWGVRCFDLRIRFGDNGRLQVAHGMFVYDINEARLLADLRYINNRGDCWVRVLNEVRTERAHTRQEVARFQEFCMQLVRNFPCISFWCGRNLADWGVDYCFVNERNPEPSCLEQYASVCPPKWIDDWWPWLFASRNNVDIVARGTDRDILLIDFVDIQ